MMECESRILMAMEHLDTQKKIETTRAKKQFEKIRERIVSERARCLDAIETSFNDLLKPMEDALHQIKENIETAQRGEKKLNEDVRITKWSQRPERMRSIL